MLGQSWYDIRSFGERAHEERIHKAKELPVITLRHIRLKCFAELVKLGSQIAPFDELHSIAWSVFTCGSYTSVHLALSLKAL